MISLKPEKKLEPFVWSWILPKNDGRKRKCIYSNFIVSWRISTNVVKLEEFDDRFECDTESGSSYILWKDREDENHKIL